MTWAHRAILYCALSVAAAAITAPCALAAEEARETHARESFAKGDYQEALDTFAVLFAENPDPIYLRNIGRCYQRLHRPDEAIDAFRRYLLRSRRLARGEREEIEGYISEMEALRVAASKKPAAIREAEDAGGPRRGDDSPAPTAPTPQPDPSSIDPRIAARPVIPSAPAIPLAPSAGTAPNITTSRPPAPAPSSSSGPLVGRWWFWAGVGTLVIGVAAVILVSREHDPQRPACPSGFACGP